MLSCLITLWYLRIVSTYIATVQILQLFTQIVSSLPRFNKRLRKRNKRGGKRRQQNQGTDSRRFLQVKNASVVAIDPRKLELVVREVTNTIVASEQDAMVPGEPHKFADGGDGISRLSSISYVNDSITVCQPNNKLCASYPAGGLDCPDSDSGVKKFGAVGYKTSLNPDETTASSGDVASEMYAITTPGCKVVKPFTYTIQRSSYDDVRIGSQCR